MSQPSAYGLLQACYHSTDRTPVQADDVSRLCGSPAQHKFCHNPDTSTGRLAHRICQVNSLERIQQIISGMVSGSPTGCSPWRPEHPSERWANSFEMKFRSLDQLKIVFDRSPVQFISCPCGFLQVWISSVLGYWLLGHQRGWWKVLWPKFQLGMLSNNNQPPVSNHEWCHWMEQDPGLVLNMNVAHGALLIAIILVIPAPVSFTCT
jgi:hypothetical protein